MGTILRLSPIPRLVTAALTTMSKPLVSVTVSRSYRKKDTPSRKNRKKSLTELAELQKTGAELTPEEAERLAAYRRKKADQKKARCKHKKVNQPEEKVS